MVVADGPAAADNATRMVRAPIKAVVSRTIALFFNVVCNELKTTRRAYLMHRPEVGDTFTLRATDDTPFFHHVAMLTEIPERRTASGELFTHHFNTLRTIFEKTAILLRQRTIFRPACRFTVLKTRCYTPALSTCSVTARYDIYSQQRCLKTTSTLFRRILGAFLDRIQVRPARAF